MKVNAFLHHPPGFTEYSGMFPLVDALGAYPVFYEETWRKVQNRFWKPGYKLKWQGDLYYGSCWNALVPYIDEWRIARKARPGADVAHFIWSEFASPSREGWFRKKAKILVGTFHASARKLPEVIRENYRALEFFDGITLMSETQKPFFIERGFPEDRIRVILHGVNIRHFLPGPREPVDNAAPLKGLLVGSTERDHAFMASVMRALPPGTLELTVLTNAEQRARNYNDTPGVIFPGHMADAELLKSYQQSDLLVMPMLDCTANNVVLEAMSCGTPVMVNRVGGISEYADSECNYVLDDKNVDEWVSLLVQLREDKQSVEHRRPAVRAWAEKYDWQDMARGYVTFYNELMERAAA